MSDARFGGRHTGVVLAVDIDRDVQIAQVLLDERLHVLPVQAAQLIRPDE